jgi:hypothetical protein
MAKGTSKYGQKTQVWVVARNGLLVKPYLQTDDIRQKLTILDI